MVSIPFNTRSSWDFNYIILTNTDAAHCLGAHSHHSRQPEHYNEGRHICPHSNLDGAMVPGRGQTSEPMVRPHQLCAHCGRRVTAGGSLLLHLFADRPHLPHCQAAIAQRIRHCAGSNQQVLEQLSRSPALCQLERAGEVAPTAPPRARHRPPSCLSAMPDPTWPFHGWELPRHHWIQSLLQFHGFAVPVLSEESTLPPHPAGRHASSLPFDCEAAHPPAALWRVARNGRGDEALHPRRLQVLWYHEAPYD